MNRTWPLWLTAFILTALSAFYQRRTGPTYPVSGSISMGGERIEYSLPRSHPGGGDASVRVPAPDPSMQGVLEWKRFKTEDAWTRTPMQREGMELRGFLPHQPPAGKLAYRVVLMQGGESATLPGEPAVIRFRGDVPGWVLILHVIVIFGAMLLSTRTGLEIFRSDPAGLRRLVFATIALLFAGGLVLGPVVQKYAFGAYWTGWPFGHDLTDNKTAIALLAWIAAATILPRSRKPARWALAAALVTLAVFLIPHSLLGSELDYKAMDAARPPAAEAP
ncbi:MAG: hypothetical protein WB626_00040 [Bacteroidota bacterium]